VTLVLGNNGIQVNSLMPAKPAAGSAGPPASSASSASSTPTSSDGTVTTNAAQTGCIN
jgi:hypothetical protein